MSRPHVLLLALALVVMPLVAAAQPTTAEETSRAHFTRGKSLAASRKFADAYREFEAGYRASPKPAFLFNMGEAARGMGDVVKARVAYERFLAAEPSGQVAETARKRLAELGPVVGPAPAPPPGPLAPWEPTVPTPTQAAVRIEAAPPPTVVVRSETHVEARPLWKKWPLWAAVGGVIAAGIVVGAVVTRDGEPSCDAGCIDFR